jgi:hypothetical protein
VQKVSLCDPGNTKSSAWFRAGSKKILLDWCRDVSRLPFSLCLSMDVHWCALTSSIQSSWSIARARSPTTWQVSRTSCSPKRLNDAAVKCWPKERIRLCQETRIVADSAEP